MGRRRQVAAVSLLRDVRDHPIRAFAILCVAVIAAYIGWMAYRINEILSGPGWCRTALGAEKASVTDGTIKGLDACVALLSIQLKRLASNSHILFGSLALCLVALIVIVVAKGRLEFDAGAEGIKGKVSSDEPVPVTVEQPPDKPVPVAPKP